MLKDVVGCEPRPGSGGASRQNVRRKDVKPYEPEVVYASVPPYATVEDIMGNHLDQKTASISKSAPSLKALFEIYQRAWEDGSLDSHFASREDQQRLRQKLGQLRSNVARLKANSMSKGQVKGNGLTVGS